MENSLHHLHHRMTLVCETVKFLRELLFKLMCRNLNWKGICWNTTFTSSRRCLIIPVQMLGCDLGSGWLTSCGAFKAHNFVFHVWKDSWGQLVACYCLVNHRLDKLLQYLVCAHNSGTAQKQQTAFLINWHPQHIYIVFFKCNLSLFLLNSRFVSGMQCMPLCLVLWEYLCFGYVTC